MPRAPLMFVSLLALGQVHVAHSGDGTSQEIFGSVSTIVVASGREQPARTAPAVATVITAQEIRDYGFRNVIEALALVPGIHLGIARDYSPLVMVRGYSNFQSSNVLFLLDGIPQIDRIGGNGQDILGTIPLDMIDRIEVTRGPGSSAFGADAFSAVVNVITKKSIDQSSITLSGGSYNTMEGRFVTGHRFESGGLVIGAEGFSTDGPRLRALADNYTPIDDALGTHDSYAPGEIPTDQSGKSALLNLTIGKTQAMLRLTSRSQSMGTGIFGMLDPYGTIVTDNAEARVTHEFGLRDDLSLTTTFDVSHATIDWDRIGWIPVTSLLPNGASMSTLGHETFARLRMDLRYEGIENHFLTTGFGLDYEDYEVSARSFSFPISLADYVSIATAFASLNPVVATILGSNTELLEQYQAVSTSAEASGAIQVSDRVASFYIQDEWTFAPRWALTYGARVDDYSEFGTQVSPRAVLVWTPLPEWTAKLLYGEGFRAPVVSESTLMFYPLFWASTDLVPERLRTSEFALTYSPKPSLEISANVFHQSTLDQIRHVSYGAFVTSENTGHQVAEGFELSAQWRMSPSLSLRGWYAFQNNVQTETDQDVGDAPHHQFYASLLYNHGPWLLNLQGLYVGDRARAPDSTNTEQPDKYGVVNLLTRYDLNRHVSLQLDVRNLFDTDAKETYYGTTLTDLSIPGRTVYGSLTLRW